MAESEFGRQAPLADPGRANQTQESGACTKVLIHRAELLWPTEELIFMCVQIGPPCAQGLDRWKAPAREAPGPDLSDVLTSCDVSERMLAQIHHLDGCVIQALLRAIPGPGAHQDLAAVSCPGNEARLVDHSSDIVRAPSLRAQDCGRSPGVHAHAHTHPAECAVCGGEGRRDGAAVLQQVRGPRCMVQRPLCLDAEAKRVLGPVEGHHECIALCLDLISTG